MLRYRRKVLATVRLALPGNADLLAVPVSDAHQREGRVLDSLKFGIRLDQDAPDRHLNVESRRGGVDDRSGSRQLATFTASGPAAPIQHQHVRPTLSSRPDQIAP